MVVEGWCKNNLALSNTDRYLIKEHISKFTYRPKISIITPVYNTKASWFEGCVKSVLGQAYPNWEWCICDNGTTDPATLRILDRLKSDPRVRIVRVEENIGIVEGSNLAIKEATGDYSAVLDSDDILIEVALYYIAEVLNQNRNLKFLYTDELFMDPSGELIDVFFKPDWSPDFLRSRNYIDHLKIFRTDILQQLKLHEGYEGSHDYDLLLRMSEVCEKDSIGHISVPCYIWRQSDKSHSRANVSYPISGAIKALEEHLERNGKKAKVLWEWPWYRVKYEVQDPKPPVAIVVPSANKDGMLLQYIQNIFHKTTYSNFCIYLCITPDIRQIIENRFRYFVDNQKIKFVDRDKNEPYNFSVFNNRMVEACEEEFVLQMNDDVEPLVDDWLDELVGLALQDNVAAVGSRLLYPNMTVQHVGCALGIFGVCEHLFKRSHYTGIGYHGMARLIRNVSMVTAACVLVRKSAYKEVGGYDENLAVAFNDVDFCIKLIKAGYFNVINPYSLLIHHESATRGLDDTPAKKELCNKEGTYLVKKWGSFLQSDPYYNVNLTLQNVNCEIDYKSRHKKPWTR